jgi:uncharacterized phage protein gp47/JayE
MVAQLRLIDPSVSAEVGTPERKIIDTVAQALNDSQIDLIALSTSLDIDSKFGEQLDRFLTIFGFSRQKATHATGFVKFSRLTPSTLDIVIPAGATVKAKESALADQDDVDASYYTLFEVTLAAGETEIFAPIRANLPGSMSNVGVNRVTQIVVSPILGITGVTNDAPVTGGQDAESDEEYKVRFKNTIFRNLAGTQDQYLALAASTPFSTKANVVGPQSRYREYIQIPPVDDASAYDVNDIDADPNTGQDPGGGNAGEYTTALSSLPYAKAVYHKHPVFVSNGRIGIETIFFRQEIDFRFNGDAARYRGDTKRFADTGIGLPLSDPDATHQPNVTFTNIYTGIDPDIEAVRPNDVVLMEYNYMSKASRNDLERNVSNAVDVYIDGEDQTLASNITTRPTSTSAFIDNPNSVYHYENYRRLGQPEKRPILGNVLMPLFWQPSLEMPEEITVNENIYRKNTHYWAVTDVSEFEGTIRARNGIEWSSDVRGQLPGDDEGGPYTGILIIEHPINTPVEILEYLYDKNLNTLQSTLESSKQVTTDVLAHKATVRYFKLDINLMYTSGASINSTNESVHEALDRNLKSLYFGNIIQLSDLLGIIHNIAGVDNVRWSSDTPGNTILNRVFEVDRQGRPLTNVTVDRFQTGASSKQEIQALYLVGRPKSGKFNLAWNNQTTASIDVNNTNLKSAIQTALSNIGGSTTVTEDVRSTLNVRYPIRSFKIAFTTGIGNGIPSNGSRTIIKPVAVNLSGGPYIINNDFFLGDDELVQLPETIDPAPVGRPDTLPGLIIRPRAQNTWQRS